MRCLILFVATVAATAVHGQGSIEVTATGTSETRASTLLLRFTVSASDDVASGAIEKFTAARRRGSKAFKELEIDGLRVEKKGLKVTREAPTVDRFSGIVVGQQTNKPSKKVVIAATVFVFMPVPAGLNDVDALLRIGEIIDAAVDAGLDTSGEAINAQLAMVKAIYGQSNDDDETPPLLSVRVANAEAIREGAYENAIANARKKAEKLARLTGVRITGVRDTKIEKGAAIRPSPDRLTRAQANVTVRMVFTTFAN